ncbi:hypothetical protein A3467_03505 [Enterobacter roggenkampii]|nr:hypothetical protein A3467_03505 [Enterobacter roggenkampii]
MLENKEVQRKRVEVFIIFKILAQITLKLSKLITACLLLIFNIDTGGDDCVTTAPFAVKSLSYPNV